MAKRYSEGRKEQEYLLSQSGVKYESVRFVEKRTVESHTGDSHQVKAGLLGSLHSFSFPLPR